MGSNRCFAMSQWLSYGLGISLLGLVLTSIPQTIHAGSKKVRIAVLPMPAQGLSQDTGSWLHRLLHWSLKKHPKIEILEDAKVKKALTERPLPVGYATRLRLCKRYIKRAKQLYAVKQLPLAKRSRYVLKALKVAEKMVERVKSHLADPTIIRDMLLYRTLAYMGLGQQLKTRTAMLKLVQFAPNFDPTGLGFPSSFTRYHQTIARWIKGQNQYTMKLDSIPSNAKLYHNYTLVGRTPYTLRNLVPGSHFIRVVAPGYKVWEKSAQLNVKRLGKRRVITAKIPLQRDPAALSIDNIPIFEQDAAISDDIMDKLKAIIKRLKIKHLYIVEARRTANGDVLRFATFQMGYTRIRYRVVPIGKTRSSYRLKIRAFARLLGQSIAPSPIVRQPVRTRTPVRTLTPTPRVIEPKPRRTTTLRPTQPIVRRTVRIRPRPRKPIQPKKVGPTPFYGTWWFWTATIGGAAAIAAGVVVVMNLNGPPPSATIIITTQTPNTAQ